MNNKEKMRNIIMIFTMMISSFLKSQSLEYMKVLNDSSILNANFIAIGEASHGISEFQTLRKDLFWILNEKLGFNTILLEAGFSETLRINDALNKNSNDDLKFLLDSLGYYPWRSQEMLSFLYEIRNYNIVNKNKINIYGFDMQMIEYSIEILKLLLRENKSLFNEYQVEQLNKLSADKIDLDTRSILESIFMEIENLFESNLISIEDKLKLYNLKIISQYIDLELDDDENIRDSSMAVNIEFLNKIIPGLKGLIIAHNGHIAKCIQEDNYVPMGFYLKSTFKDKYFAIGTECGTGSFIAANPKLYSKGVKNYFQIFKIGKIEKNIFPHYLEKLAKGNNSYYLNSDEILIFSKKIRATDLLGIHEKDKRNFWNIIPKDCFDSIFYFSLINPLNLYFLNEK